MPQILELQEATGEVAEQLAELIADLPEICGFEPVPVRLHRNLDGDSGRCSYIDHELGEISICAHLAARAEPGRLQGLYLHEVAHRLLPEDVFHDARFAALLLVLLRRAGLEKYQFKIYDIQDESWIAESFGWAWRLSERLAASDLPAAACAAEICDAWHTKLATIAKDQAREEHALQHALAHVTSQRDTARTGLVFGGLAGFVLYLNCLAPGFGG